VTAAPIAYDKPILNLIAGLDATGHVTNTPYRKLSITWHHNGGRLSLQGCLDVWKTREASAHFDVDGNGNVAQYAGVNMYAWHAGNTQGNIESIGIEMCNETLAPDWRVAPATWHEAARLAGWLHARVIGVRPSRATCHVHHDWKSTACAGPYIDSILGQMIAEAQAAYDAFVGGGAPAPAPAPSGGGGGKSISQVASEVIRGGWGNGNDRINRLRAAGYDPNAVQAEVNRLLGGGAPAPAPAPGRASDTEIAHQVIAGQWGNGADRISRLRGAGYDPNAVQAEVNRILGGGGSPSPPPPSKSVEQLAREVIAGEWGNGSARSQRLAAAGFNPTAVQAEVNRILGGGGTAQTTAPTRLSIGVLAQQVIAGQWGNGPARRQRLTAAGYDYNAVQAEVNRRLG
jgi:hypothetical protein